MRVSHVAVLAIAASCCTLRLEAADKGQAPGSDGPGNKALMVEQLAQRIFKEADANHNDVLNKGEFENAQQMVSVAVEQMAREGLLNGQSKRGRKSPPAAANLADAKRPNFSGAPRKRPKAGSAGNRIEVAEFTRYVQSVVDQAEDSLAQMRLEYYRAQRQGYGVPQVPPNPGW